MRNFFNINNFYFRITAVRRPLYSIHFQSAVAEYDAALASHHGLFMPPIKYITNDKPIDHDQFVRYVSIELDKRPKNPQFDPRPCPKKKRKRRSKLLDEIRNIVPWHAPETKSYMYPGLDEIQTMDIHKYIDVRPKTDGSLAPWHFPVKRYVLAR